ncbi:hypothetical protein [Paenibacillus sp. FSL R10-2734]|uniref:hypothetical protein n=1 Tax=Paenibacillus sp. FSL R10-2734 TaxID=2954691 RepID=UPI0030DC4AE7
MKIHMKMKDFSVGCVRLLPGPLKKRFDLNKQYIMSLTNENLLRNFYLESGLWSYSGNGGTTSATTTSLDGLEHCTRSPRYMFHRFLSIVRTVSFIT